MAQERISWLDFAKGIGMIAVIMDHTIIFPYPITQYVDAFHMPLFFFLSGYLFALKKYPSFNLFAGKKTRSLLVPYLFFAIGSYFWWLYEWRMGEHPDINVYKPIIGTFLAIRDTQWTNHTGALWFIVCLFVTEMLFFVIHRISKNNKVYLISTIGACTLVGVIYHYYINLSVFMNIDAAFMVILFFGLGYLFHEWSPFLIKYLNLQALILFFLLSLGVAMWNDDVDILHNQYGNYLLFYAAAILGIFTVILFSKIINKNQVIEYIGRNSLIILAVNPFILAVMRRIIHLPNGLPYYSFILIGICYTTIALILSVPVIYVINNRLPFIVGGKKMKRTLRKDAKEEIHAASGGNL
jgi:acyltransferase